MQIDGGCPCYSRQGDTLVAGDRKGVLRRIDARDGTVLDEIRLGGPLTTAPLVVDRAVFVLGWSSKRASPALVALET